MKGCRWGFRWVGVSTRLCCGGGVGDGVVAGTVPHPLLARQHISLPLLVGFDNSQYIIIDSNRYICM